MRRAVSILATTRCLSISQIPTCSWANLDALVSPLSTACKLRSHMEIIAIVLALIYLGLAAKQSAWCWLAGAISCAIYAYLMFGVQLYMEAALQLIYVVIAGYGWWHWRFGAAQAPAQEQPGYSWRWHGTAILLLSLLAIAAAL